jgi:signal transduction histidine kinase
MQEALAAVRVREEFLSVAAHELKTPLASLKLQVQLLSRNLEREGPGGGQQLVARLRRLDRQIDRLDALNNSLLDLSRLRSGQLALAQEQVDLSQRLQDVLEEARVEAVRVGCELRGKVQPGVVGWWDVLRLEQVILNLLGNALKYGEGMPVEVSLRADEETAVLEVRDFGIGIPPDAQARIFQKFERAVSPLRFAGLGLGLYITREIVDSFGGTITVESSPGAGALFQVRLPRQRPASSGQQEYPPRSGTCTGALPARELRERGWSSAC